MRTHLHHPRGVRTSGSILIEFVLVIPLFALTIVFFIGTAQTALLRQYAVVASRQAAFYQRLTGCVASSALIMKDVPAADSPWQMSQGAWSSGNQSQMSSLAQSVSSVANFITNAAGGFVVTATSRPTRGYVAQRFGIANATEDYALLQGYWMNDQCSVMMSALSGALGFLSRILGITNPQPGDGCVSY